MSEPVLAYKKPNLSSLSIASSPNPNSSARKVLDRRKALQQFYHLQRSANVGPSNSEPNGVNGDANVTVSDDDNSTISGSTSNAPEASKSARKRGTSLSLIEGHELEIIQSLDEPGKLEELVQTETIEEILKIRNYITHNLNSHEAEKKSIIYDNYYELIELSQVLHGLLHAQTLEYLAEGGSSVLAKKKEVVRDITDEYVDDILNSLVDFVNSTAPLTASKFEDIKVEAGSSDDDNASVRTIVEQPELETDLSVQKVEGAVWAILNSSRLDDGQKRDILEQVRKLVQKTSNPLLINQLHMFIHELKQ